MSETTPQVGTLADLAQDFADQVDKMTPEQKAETKRKLLLGTEINLAKLALERRK